MARALAALAFLFCLPVYALVPRLVAHEGRILRVDGTVERGTLTMTFSLYSTPTGGSPLWSETRAVTLSTEGYYAIALGTVTPIPELDGDLWLGVAVQDEPEMLPRARVGAAVYALRAAASDDAARLGGDVPSAYLKTTSPLDAARLMGSAVPGATNLAVIGAANAGTLSVTEVKLGSSGAPCPGNAGAMRYEAGQFYGCDGAAWRQLSPDVYLVAPANVRRWSDGTVARSCNGYLRPGPGYAYRGEVGDGVYAIDPDGPGGNAEFNVWCDMTRDGGGWTLIMRFKADGSMPFGNARWTDSSTYNDDPNGSLSPSVNANLKSPAFFSVAGWELRGCKEGAAPCFIQSGPQTGPKTVQSLFAEPYKPGVLPRNQLVALFGEDSTQPNCNVSGINLAAYGYGGARFGLIGNNENDCATPDSGWGFGVFSCGNQNRGCGAGLAGWANGGCPLSCAQGHLWIR